MKAIALMIAQTATVTVPADRGAPCAASPREIVVCGHAPDADRYRLPAPTTDEPAGPPRAEWGLGGGVRAGIEVTRGPTIQGVPGNRVMAKVRIAF